MAIRTKTVEYAFPTDVTALATATRRDFTAITLFLPETSSRAFVSVRLRVSYRGNNATAASLTSPLLGIKLGAAAFSDATLGNPPANSGENEFFVFERDVTSYFTTNFGAGGSQTCQVGVQQSGLTIGNISAKLIITYEFDDASATTRVKTVRIPLESGTGALTATLAAIGTNQIPALDSFLPEASKTYRRIWLELYYNEYTAGATNDASLESRVQGSLTFTSTAHESALGSSCAGICYQDLTGSLTTSAVQTWELRSTNITTASTFNHVAGVLHVTYEYDHDASTTILNSLMIPLCPIVQAGGTTSSDAARMNVDFVIEEPATITLVQSGALVWYTQTAAVGPNIGFGAQTPRGYTDTAQVFCGCTFLSQRIDSGGAAGAGITLTRGTNTLSWRAWTSTLVTTVNNFQGFAFLNYTSGKDALGADAHNKTLIYNVQNSLASGTGGNITAVNAVAIGDTNWWRWGLAYFSMNYVAAPTTLFATLDAEKASGELDGVGFQNQGVVSMPTVDGENGLYPLLVPMQYQAASDWQRRSDNQEGRMQLEVSRRYRFFTSAASTRPLALVVNVHAITKTVGGTISESSGGTVSVDVHRDDTGERVAETSRTGNGAYTATVFGNSFSVYARARESAVLTGSSETSNAT